VAAAVAAAAVAVLIAWFVLGYLYILNPTSTSHPRRADAIVVLGPSLPDRVAQAVRLADELGVGQLAVSIGDTSGQATAYPCAGAPAALEVTCFVPAPYTTRGEAREVGTLARERGWRSVIVIAPTPSSAARTCWSTAASAGPCRWCALPSTRASRAGSTSSSTRAARS
jgi:uncharacterized SAM-binding protein YcdF (DUF218 family)